MVNNRNLPVIVTLAVLFLVFTSGAWALSRGARSADAVSAFQSRISRGNKLFSLGSPGGGSESSNNGNDPVMLFESVPAPSSPASTATTNGNSNGGSSSVPVNLNLYLNLIGVSIDGQNIWQGNNLDSTQLALISQNASADLIAMNIATIIQNNIQIGLNFNVSPIINVVVANSVAVPVDVSVETPDINVGPIDIQVGGV